MNDKFFIDTNIFIYQLDTEDPVKSSICDEIVLDGIASSNGCISFQVVQETLNVLLKKSRKTVSIQEASDYFDSTLEPLFNIPATPALYQRSLNIIHRYQFSYYDSLIIAAALESGCRLLFSEDFQHQQIIESLKIQNPFV